MTVHPDLTPIPSPIVVPGDGIGLSGSPFSVPVVPGVVDPGVGVSVPAYVVSTVAAIMTFQPVDTEGGGIHNEGTMFSSLTYFPYKDNITY